MSERTGSSQHKRHGGGCRDPHLGAHAEQGAHGESTRGKTFVFAFPLSNMEFTCLGFLLGILDGYVFALVSLEDGADIWRFVYSNR